MNEGKQYGVKLENEGFLLLREEGETFWFAASIGLSGELIQDNYTPEEIASNLLFLWGIFQQEKEIERVKAYLPKIEEFIETASSMFPTIGEELQKLLGEARRLEAAMPRNTIQSIN